MKRYLNSFDSYISKNFNSSIQDWIRLLFKSGAVVISYFILHKGLFWLTTLPFDSYYNPFIYFEFLKRLTSNPILLLGIVLFFGFHYKRLSVNWKDFGNTNAIRNFLFIITLALTWFYATYGINYYFNQVHLWDRLLLIFLCITVYFKPIFLPLYLTVLLCIIGQFDFLPKFSIATPPFLLIKLLILFVTFFFIKLITKSFNVLLFIFFVGCIIATHYVTPGVRKFNTYWIFKNQINFLVPSAYANGWLSFLNKETVESLTEFLSTFNTPLRFFAIIIECGMLLFFFHLKWARFLIFGAAVMHIGIFGYSGIFFWMWIVTLMASLLLFNSKTFRLREIFNRKHAVVSIFIILGGFIWCDARSLTWCDAPLSYTYKIFGETEDGKQYRLGPKFFSHYDYQMTHGNVKFWQSEPRLPIVWGATNASLSDYFNTERTPREVLLYEKENGNLHEDTSKQETYENFIKKYVKHWNNRSNKNKWITYLSAPSFYWTTPASEIEDVNTDIKRIVIKESTTFYSKSNGFKEIRNQDIRELIVEDAIKH